MRGIGNHSFVMDCSVAIALVFSDEHDATNIESILLTEESTILVPSIWFYEVSNVLRTALHKTRIQESELIEMRQLLISLDVTVDDGATRAALHSTLEIACSYNLSAYDAAYVELCIRHQLPLATLDIALIRAARKIGISVLV